MIARARGVGLLAPSALAMALIVGLIAAVAPLVAVGAVVGMAFAILVFADLAAGFAVLGLLSFLEVLPTSGGLSLAKAAGLVLAVAWLARFSTRQHGRDFFTEYAWLTWAIIAFLAWAALTLLWATDTGNGISAISRYVPNMLLLPIAYMAIRTRRDLLLVLIVIVAGAVIAASFGILEPPSSTVVQEGAERVTGTIGDPNELAAALLLGLGLGAGLALSRGRASVLRLWGAVAIPICIAGIFLSLSRGGLIALGALLVAGTFLAGRWRRLMVGILVVIVAGGVLYFTQIASLPARERVTTSAGGSGRSDLWTVGWRMVRAHPLEGVGVGNFQVVSANYVLQPGVITRAELIFSSAPKIAHNTYLEVLSEMGVPGLLLFMLIVVGSLACVLRAARVWSARGDVGMEALARSVLLALIGMLVADFFISQTYNKLLWTMLALGPAMLALARREDRDGDVALSGQPISA
ncbi:MAG: O-antigen ligase family protein [Solirubrobacteraceae bacterium]